MLGLKLTHVSKSSHWVLFLIHALISVEPGAPDAYGQKWNEFALQVKDSAGD